MLQRIGQWRIKEAMRTYSGVFKPNIAIVLANTIQNHFVEGFRYGGYRTNASMGGWRERQFTGGKGKRATLIGKGSGVLRRDIKKRITTFNLIVVGTSALTDSYASIHNEGGKIKITPKMRKFFWYMHSKVRNEDEKNYWKSLALHKGSEITIPKREFIGNSRHLEVKLEKRIDQELQKLFK
jgi:phage gpG-like protein